MVVNANWHKRRKIIDLRHNYILYIICTQKLAIKHIPGIHQKEYLLTKPLRRIEYLRQRVRLELSTTVQIGVIWKTVTPVPYRRQGIYRLR